jgi:uncharacterized protein YcaQ
MVTSLSLVEARRLALTAQGFGQTRPRRATVRHLRDTIRRLGLLQIDCVNVGVRGSLHGSILPFGAIRPRRFR